MKGPFGILLVGGGIILLIGLFTGKITFPGGGSPIDPIAAQTNTPAQNLSLALFGQANVPPAVQAANRAGEPKQNVGVLPSNGKCPPGTSYLPWDGKCYKLQGI